MLELDVSAQDSLRVRKADGLQKAAHSRQLLS